MVGLSRENDCMVNSNFYNDNEQNEFYDTIKQKYLNFDNMLDAPKLRCLFTFEPRLLSKFLLKIFQLRQDFLYA